MMNLIAASYRFRNRLHSFILLSAMLALLSLVGWLLLGPIGIAWFLTVGVFAIIGATRASPRIILLMHGARPLRPEEAPYLYQIITRLCQRAGINNIPTLYYIPARLMDIFTTGLSNSTSIALSYGLVRQLSTRELTGVLAHEISHIRSNDLFVMLVASVISSLTSMMALAGSILVLIYIPLYVLTDEAVPWALLMVLMFAPTASALMQLALSRSRELRADLEAVRLTDDPLSLASALEKIESYQLNWMERILMSSRRIRIPSIFRTHPLVSDRVARLKSLAGESHPL
jgi:heat shock protein HtpX